MAKTDLHRQAVNLRRKGWSYTEILGVLPVAKSTLSYWLRDVPLSTTQQRRLHGKRADPTNASKALSAKYRAVRKKEVAEATSEFEDLQITRDALAFVGASLYWAEGSKKPNSSFGFANADVHMVKVYLVWLTKILGVPHDRIVCSVSVWLNGDLTYEDVQRYWERQLQIPSAQFNKPHINTVENKKTTQTRKTVLPYGVMRIRVKGMISKCKAQYVAIMGKMGKDVDYVQSRSLE